MTNYESAEPVLESFEAGHIENKSFYSANVRMLIDFYNHGELTNVSRVTVEPRYGYVATVDYKDGGRRIMYGGDSGLNLASSKEVASDKAYSKFMLRSLGINCPEGDDFLLPWWAETLRQAGRQKDNTNIQDTSQAHDYIVRDLEYPVYVKPVSGSQGNGVYKVHDEQELIQAFDEYNDRLVKVALVERALAMPDYRLLVIDGTMVAAYERQPMNVVGNGRSDIESLISGLDSHVEMQLPSVRRHLGRVGLTLADVPPPGVRIRLSDVSNLSAGGTAVDVGEIIHPYWSDVASTIADGFNLRLCGIDLACQDITSAESDYSVIEVNSSPGTAHYMASSDEATENIKAVFRDQFNHP